MMTTKNDAIAARLEKQDIYVDSFNETRIELSDSKVLFALRNIYNTIARLSKNKDEIRLMVTFDLKVNPIGESISDMIDVSPSDSEHFISLKLYPSVCWQEKLDDPSLLIIETEAAYLQASGPQRAIIFDTQMAH